MEPARSPARSDARRRSDADYVFFELTRSICPTCLRIVDAHILLRDNRVYMRKRCPEHGEVEALVYGDAEAYVAHLRFNRPGSIPLEFSTDVKHGCPHDCGLCPDHQQHACVGIIEVNSGCNMDCPLCFANAGPGFSLTLGEVEEILDHFVTAEGQPDVVQFSGGEPTIHPDLIPMIRAARAREIPLVFINTNGRRIAWDDEFLGALAEVKPALYFQFDGFEDRTYELIRGEAGLLSEKIRALDRLAEAGLHVVLVPAIERGVNDHEVGDIVRFALEHPAVRAINFQPAFHAGRFLAHDPMQRVTIPDVIGWIEEQTTGLFTASDFVPIPCCFPTCNSATYAYVEEHSGEVIPLPRLLEVEHYLDFVTNRAVPTLDEELRQALAGLWSTAALPGSDRSAADLALSCAACDLPSLDLGDLYQRFFMIMLQDFMDPWTFNQKNAMKCCKEILLPGGKQIPFCTYNSVGYREQASPQLAAQQHARHEAQREDRPFTGTPIVFDFSDSRADSDSRGDRER
jgi:7,8-dihydro-6-hydroxymethylpterin dimethyltransferase